MPTSYGYISVQLATDLLDKVYATYDVKGDCHLRHYQVKHGERNYSSKLIVYVAKTGKRPKDNELIVSTCGHRNCVNFNHLKLVPAASTTKRAKLRDDEVRLIRTSPLTATALATKFGVAISTICGIRRGTSYKHVK